MKGQFDTFLDLKYLYTPTIQNGKFTCAENRKLSSKITKTQPCNYLEPKDEHSNCILKLPLKAILINLQAAMTDCR